MSSCHHKQGNIMRETQTKAYALLIQKDKVKMYQKMKLDKA